MACELPLVKLLLLDQSRDELMDLGKSIGGYKTECPPSEGVCESIDWEDE